MNAQELFNASGAAADIYYCGKCRVVHREQVDAEQCCVPVKCGCGADCERYFTKCRDCQQRDRHRKEAEHHEAAPKRTPFSKYKGDWVYLACEHDYIRSDDLADRIADEPDTTWLAYACTPHRPSIDIADVVSNALEDSYEDAYNDVSSSALAELVEHVDAWCGEHMPISYEQDPKHAIDIDTEPGVGGPDCYPLYCVDRGDTVDPECQYVGPFTTHDEAIEALDPDAAKQVVRRCRQLKPSEVAYDTYAYDPEDFEVLSALVDDIDEAATSGNLPDGAWYCMDKRAVSAKYDDDTLPTKVNFSTWIDDRLVVEAWICEGDE